MPLSSAVIAEAECLQIPGLPECHIVFGDQTELQVNPVRMMLLSPIMSTILHPYLVDLRNGKEQHITAFQDEDPKTMSFLVSALHGHAEFPNPLSLQFIQDVALLVNKFECAEAMDLLSAMWITALVVSADKEDSPIDWTHKMCDIVSIAYYLDSPANFSLITQKLIMHSVVDFTEGGNPNYSAPTQVFTTIDKKKRDLYNKLLRGLDAAVNNFMACLTSACTNCTMVTSNGVNCATKYLATYGQEFRPPNAPYDLGKLIELKLRKLVEKDAKAIVRAVLCQVCKAHAILNLQNLVTALQDVGTEVEVEVEGICLDCLKSSIGHKDKSTPCRILHDGCPPREEGVGYGDDNDGDSNFDGFNNSCSNIEHNENDESDGDYISRGDNANSDSFSNDSDGECGVEVTVAADCHNSYSPDNDGHISISTVSSGEQADDEASTESAIDPDDLNGDDDADGIDE